MTIRTLTILGFALLAAAAAVLHLAGRSGRLGLVSLSEVTDVLCSTRVLRFALVLAWAWVGWHLLAR